MKSSNLFTAFIFSFIIIGMASCRKEVKGPTVVYGKVLEQGTQKPVPNALVKLVNANGNFHPNFEVIHDSTRTDSTGYYEIEIDKAFSEDIMVYAKAENYFNHQDDDDDISLPGKNVNQNRTQNVSIIVKPYSYISFLAGPNVNGYSVYVNTIPGNDYNDGFGFFLNASQPNIRRALGNQTISIACFKMVGGLQTENKVLEVQTSAIDTLSLQIEF